MTFPTFSPPIGPSPGTAHNPKIDLWSAEFGDGYTQDTPKGLNHIKDVVPLKWDALSYNDMRTICGFMEAQGGCKPFYYKPYGSPNLAKWVCKTWSSVSEGGLWSVSAELTQSFLADA